MTIGERIRQRRMELGMTQDELAKKTGYVSRSSINKLESARVLPSRKIEKMANALECTISFLMGETDDPNEVSRSISLTEDEIRMVLEMRDVPEDIKKTIRSILDNAPTDGRKS